jgi:DNA-binding response OmpR family regulator
MRARVLVVEDETLLADTLCDLLLDAGCEPVGPAANVAVALRLIEQSRIDVAILDVRLMDEMSFAVAYALQERGIPLMFLTGDQGSTLPVDLGDAIVVEKPFKTPMLIEAVRRLASLAAAARRSLSSGP